MSIFNVTVDNRISGSLATRQTLMGKDNRTIQELAFLNSNTSWVKLSSSVNIGSDKGKTAEDNVLAGGILVDNKPKSGVGGDSKYAYSLKNSDGSENILGIRPMPGITSVSVDNIGAYGSIRKATVNFQCWDVQQLELLEQLYMRPGYTVLLEYGRTTYLTDKGLQRVTSQTNFFTQQNIDLQVYLKKLYTDSLNSGGNYDAFFGYITNYSWSVRDDGGYDCKTEILSTGEILESIKVNYSIGGEIDFSKFGIDNSPKRFRGYLFPIFNPTMAKVDIAKLNEEYSTNVLAGLITEIYLLCRYDRWTPNISKAPANQSINLGVKYGKLDYMRMFYNSPSQSPSEAKLLNNGTSYDNYFITLESFANLFTKLILPDSRDDGNKKTGDLVGFSTKNRGYLGKGAEDLLCLFNTYMTSTNPDVCVIKSPQWASILADVNISFEQSAPVNTNVLNDPDITGTFQTKIANWVRRLVTSSVHHPKGTNATYEAAIRQTLVDISNDFIASKLSLNDYLLKFNKNYQSIRSGNETTTTTKIIDAYTDPSSGIFVDEQTIVSTTTFRSWIGYRGYLYGTDITNPNWVTERDILRNRFKKDETFGDFIFSGRNPLAGTINVTGLKLTTIELSNSKFVDTALDAALQAQVDIIMNASAASATAAAANTTLRQVAAIYADHIKQCKQEFKYQPYKEIAYGNTSNIYVNLKFLYKLATDATLMSQDSTGKNSLSAMSFLTPMARGIQTALGNVNNFSIHIDPIDGIARMVDINYVNTIKTPDLFKFEIGSNKSIVRNLNLESQIFSDQSSMIAISAQSDAGRLGLDNSTLVNYNNNITDRMIAKKDAPLSTINPSNINDQLSNFISSLAVLSNRYLKPLFPATGPGTYNANEADSYSNALRDVINFISSIRNSDNKDKGFIPTQISLTIDGIAGWVIGNLFKVDETFIPKYYKRKASKLGYIVTKIGHQVESNSWTTIIKGYPFNLDTNTSISNDTTDVNGKPISFSIVVGYDPNQINTAGNLVVNIRAAKNRKDALDKVEAVEPGFKAKVQQVAKAIGVSEDALLAVMYQESRLNPNIVNKDFKSPGATGLIQFLPNDDAYRQKYRNKIKITDAIAKGFTYTIGKKQYTGDELQNMSRIKQMDLVLDYYKSSGLDASKPKTFIELYGYTFAPGLMMKWGGKYPTDLTTQIGGPAAYISNPTIGDFIPATNSKGQRIITVGSFIEYAKSLI
jgi:hypothetical protein